MVLTLVCAAGILTFGCAFAQTQPISERSQAERPREKSHPNQWQGTWSATGAGRVLNGTWTATEGDSPQVAVGTWALIDGSGKETLTGTWSVRKAEKTWQGAWQARIGTAGAFAGTWEARVPIVSAGTFSGLLEFATSNVVSGAWHLGPAGHAIQSGGWSIRAIAVR
jgi:hypothetical protein